MNLLVNLPPGFFSHPDLETAFARLGRAATITRTSCNKADEILPYLQQADAVLMWSWPKITDEMLDACPHLQFLAHLDITQGMARTLLGRGLPVSVAKRAFSPAVAEMALTLILATLRRTSTFHAQMAQATEPWVSRFPDDIDRDERQLTGRRVGLIGFGGIGQRLAALLAPFAVSLQVHDPFLPEGIAEKFGAQNVGVDELVAHSEILVVCAAANEGTRHVLEARHIAALAPRSVLVNVSRSSLVDSAALLSRLQTGDIYAALDVFDKEPLAPDDPLRALPNAYLTPHRAGGIMESVARLITFLTDDLEAHLAGQPRRHALTESMLSSLDA